MSTLTKTGLYRGHTIEHCMGQSSGGYPQFVPRLHAMQQYDEDTEQWVDWDAEYGGDEIIGFFVLFGGNGKPTLNLKQVQKAYNWSGSSFEELDAADFGDILIQFRVEESTYEGNTRLKVTWIDDAEANPTRQLTRLEPHEIKALDAKYAAAFRKATGGPKPKSVPKTKASKPKADKPKPPKADKPKPPKQCTMEEAWDTCCDRRHKTITDEQLAEIWNETIETLGGTEVINAEPDGWANVRDIMIEKTESEIPF